MIIEPGADALAHMGLQRAAWDVQSLNMDCVCLWALIPLARKRPVSSEFPSSRPHQRHIAFLLDFNVEAASLVVCFCLGSTFDGGRLEKGRAVFCLHVTWRFHLSRLSSVSVACWALCTVCTSASLKQVLCNGLQLGTVALWVIFAFKGSKARSPPPLQIKPFFFYSCSRLFPHVYLTIHIWIMEKLRSMLWIFDKIIGEFSV